MGYTVSYTPNSVNKLYVSSIKTICTGTFRFVCDYVTYDSKFTPELLTGIPEEKISNITAQNRVLTEIFSTFAACIGGTHLNKQRLVKCADSI